MADHEHEALAEPHERLRWARVRWQLQKGIKPEMGAAAAATCKRMVESAATDLAAAQKAEGSYR